MATPLEKLYRETRQQAITTAEAQFPDADVIVSFGEHDCVVDVIMPTESKRFVYTPDEEVAA